MTSADTSAPSFDPSFVEPRSRPLRRLLAPFAVGFALLSACLTFVVLTGLTPIEPTRGVVVSLLLINAATILLLIGIIVREVWQLVQARRRGRAAARLHVQIVSLFSVIAVLPADDGTTLAARVLTLEHRLLPAAVAWHCAGRLVIEDGRVRVRDVENDGCGALLVPSPYL